MNYETFYAYVRKNPFANKITPQQKDGIERILNHWEANYADQDPRKLAYILATVFHETAATMQPIKEKGTKAYLKAKPYWPWYGRGLVQITWEENYKKFDLTANPDDALKWPVALRCLFEGMFEGKYTGKRLSQYFTAKKEAPKAARAIVNGSDKAGLIADYYTAFKGALEAAEKPVQPEDVPAGSDVPDVTPIAADKSVWSVLATMVATVLTTVLSSVNDAWGLAALALVLVIMLVGSGMFLYFRNRERYTKGV